MSKHATRVGAISGENARRSFSLVFAFSTRQEVLDALR